MGNVQITQSNGALGGTPVTNDGVAAMVIGVASMTTLTLNTVYTFHSLADALSQGLSVDDEFAYQQIAEFYAEAPVGTELWVEFMINTVLFATMVDPAASHGAKELVDASNGVVRLLGIARVPDGSYTPTTNKVIDQDCITAATNAQTLAEDYFAKYTPIHVLIEARVVNTGTPVLVDATTLSKNKVSLVVGGSAAINDLDEGGASVGAALGRLSKNTVQRNIGAVEDGNVQIDGLGYIGASTVDALFNLGTLGTFPTNGYITLFKYAQKAGYYWSDDPTATANTDDYKSVASNRVINKATILTYATYVEKVNTDVLVDATGKLDAGVAKSLEGIIENAVNTAMAGEISNFQASIDPNQNVIAQNKINIVEKVTPKAYLKEIDVVLGFENPFS